MAVEWSALYTSQVWAWGGLSHAHLFMSPDAKRVFDVTNTVAMRRSVGRSEGGRREWGARR
jgi:hypothetical protein